MGKPPALPGSILRRFGKRWRKSGSAGGLSGAGSGLQDSNLCSDGRPLPSIGNDMGLAWRILRAVALLVFLARPARTRIVAANFIRPTHHLLHSLLFAAAGHA